MGDYSCNSKKSIFKNFTYNSIKPSLSDPNIDYNKNRGICIQIYAYNTFKKIYDSLDNENIGTIIKNINLTNINSFINKYESYIKHIINKLQSDTIIPQQDEFKKEYEKMKKKEYITKGIKFINDKLNKRYTLTEFKFKDLDTLNLSIVTSENIDIISGIFYIYKFIVINFLLRYAYSLIRPISKQNSQKDIKNIIEIHNDFIKILDNITGLNTSYYNICKLLILCIENVSNKDEASGYYNSIIKGKDGFSDSNYDNFIKEIRSISEININEYNIIDTNKITRPKYELLMTFYQQLSGAVRLIVRTRTWDIGGNFEQHSDNWKFGNYIIGNNNTIEIVNNNTNEIENKYGPFYSVIKPNLDINAIADSIGISQLGELLKKENQNIVIFTYGYSGSGKTSTLFGYNSEEGIIDILLRYLETCKLEEINILYGKKVHETLQKVENKLKNSEKKLKNAEENLKNKSQLDKFKAKVQEEVKKAQEEVKKAKEEYKKINIFDEKTVNIYTNNGNNTDYKEIISDESEYIKATPNNDKSSRGFTFYKWKYQNNSLVVVDMAGSENPYDILVKTVPTLNITGDNTFLNSNDICKIDKIVNICNTELTKLITIIIEKIYLSIKAVNHSKIYKGISNFIGSLCNLLYEFLTEYKLEQSILIEGTRLYNAISIINYLLACFIIEFYFIKIKFYFIKKKGTNEKNIITTNELEIKDKKNQEEINIINKINYVIGEIKKINDIKDIETILNFKTIFINMIKTHFKLNDMKMFNYNWLKFKVKEKQINTKFENRDTILIRKNKEILLALKIYYSYYNYLELNNIQTKDLEKIFNLFKLFENSANEIEFQKNFVNLKEGFNELNVNNLITVNYLQRNNTYFKKGKFELDSNDPEDYIEIVEANSSVIISPRDNFIYKIKDYFKDELYKINSGVEKNLQYCLDLINEGFYINQVNLDLMSFFIKRKNEKKEFEQIIKPELPDNNISKLIFENYSSETNLKQTEGVPCTRILETLNSLLNDGVKNLETKYIIIANVRPTNDIYRLGCIETLEFVKQLTS